MGIHNNGITVTFRINFMERSHDLKKKKKKVHLGSLSLQRDSDCWYYI